MLSFEEIGLMLDDIADELPEDFFGELNGGISLLPDTKMHPESRANKELYILGEYNNNQMGRYISIYFGSFIKLYGNQGPLQQKQELKRILLHEFTHHLESLAGEKGLEIKDRVELEIYKQT